MVDEGYKLVEKCCSGCSLSKPLAEFQKDVRYSLGVKGRCKACIANYEATWRVEPVARERRLKRSKHYSATVRTQPSVRAKENEYHRAKRARQLDRDPITHRVKKMLHHARERAKDDGVQCTLTLADIMGMVADTCPVLGLSFDWRAKARSERSPTLDRVDSHGGYTLSNVSMISWKANRLKNDGTASDHEKIAAWMRSKLGDAVEQICLQRRMDTCSSPASRTDEGRIRTDTAFPKEGAF